MSGTITAIEFEETSCPLSPHAGSLSIVEGEAKVLITGKLPSAFDAAASHRIDVEAPSQAEALILPEGSYVMKVCLEDGEDHTDPTIRLSFQRESGGEESPGPEMSGKGMIGLIEGAESGGSDALACVMVGTFLKGGFKEWIEGSPEFWMSLSKGLSAALAPVRANLSKSPEQVKPVECVLTMDNS